MPTAQLPGAAVASSAPLARRRSTVLLGIAGVVIFGASFLVGTSLINEANAPPGKSRPSPSRTTSATSAVTEPSVDEQTTAATTGSAPPEPSALPTPQQTTPPPPIPTVSPTTPSGSSSPSTTSPPKPGKKKHDKPKREG